MDYNKIGDPTVLKGRVENHVVDYWGEGVHLLVDIPEYSHLLAHNGSPSLEKENKKQKIKIKSEQSFTCFKFNSSIINV